MQRLYNRIVRQNGGVVSVKTYVKAILLSALVVLGLGGLLLHLRVHPVSQNSSNLVTVVSGLLGVLLVPALFCFKKTVSYAYVLNGFIVILGTIAMAHYSIAHLPENVTLQSIILQTTLADILVLWGKFFVGKAIFDLEFFGYDPARPKKGITYRYPHLGWWLIHLVLVALVYYLGNQLWRQA
jgi:hypothetical protein